MFGELGVDVDGLFGDLGVDVDGLFCDLGVDVDGFFVIWRGIRISSQGKNLFKGWDHVRTMRGAICYRMIGTRASGTACDSSYGHLKF